MKTYLLKTALLCLFLLGIKQTKAQWTLATNDLYPTSSAYSVALGGTGATEILDLKNGHVNILSASAYKIGTFPILWHKGNTSSMFCGKDAGFTHGNNVPGYNTFMGNESGYTTNPNPAASSQGYYNSFYGYKSGKANVGNCNNALGAEALLTNTTGYANVAIGVGASRKSTTASRNVVIGDSAFLSGTVSNFNTIGGYKALYSLTGCGLGSTVFGHEALYNNTECPNDAFGYNALRACTLAIFNVAVGYEASSQGEVNSTTAVGYKALRNNATNYNVAVGCSTLIANTSGAGNVGMGYRTLSTNVTGAENTGVGYESLKANTGSRNTGFGFWTLTANSSGSDNVALGCSTLVAATTGPKNVGIGNYALSSITTHSFNTACGHEALKDNVAHYNSAFGYQAAKGLNNGSAYYNVAMGYQTMPVCTTGYENVAVGALTMFTAPTGSYNVGCGYATLYYHTTGDGNTAVGYEAMLGTSGSSTGDNNTALGYFAGKVNSTGSYNTYTGWEAGKATTTGGYNTCIGTSSGNVNTIGTNNTFLGYAADATGTGSNNYQNATAIGNGALVNASNKVRIGDANLITNGVEGGAAYFNASDSRFKFNISESVKGLDFILKLRPVNYQFNTEAFHQFLIKDLPDSVKMNHVKNSSDFTASKGYLHTGFLAQEVEQAAAASGFSFEGLHTPTDENDYYTLAYAQFVVPLVKAVQEQQKVIDTLKNEINSLKGSNQRSASPHDKKDQTTLQIKLNLPDELFISEPKPNPNDGKAEINYYVPSDISTARIVFRDLLGKVIYETKLNMGYGTMVLDTRELPNGTYTYSLLVDDDPKQTKKMIKQ